MKPEILTPRQMGACDAYTIKQSTPGNVLMERAGQGVADEALAMVGESARILVLAGPGNNGGDGYVAARLLVQKGLSVDVFSLGDPSKLQGDARWAFQSWEGLVRDSAELTKDDLDQYDLVVDSLFGAGLSRPLDGAAAELVEALNRSGRSVLAVDLPSGLDGKTGRADGPVVEAERSVTFHRLKPGHLLYPGRRFCGLVFTIDIGIAKDAIQHSGYAAQLTGAYLLPPELTSVDVHKYAKGHVVVLAGTQDKAGAGFLAGQAALRTGAGLVTLGAPTQTHSASVGLYPALMRSIVDGPQDLSALLKSPRIKICALGPGLSPDEKTRQLVYSALVSPVSVVLDAGALTAFDGMQHQLFELIVSRGEPVVMTPHEGEFRRLFPELSETRSKIERAQLASRQSGAIIVLKGADTVIAHPNGDSSCTFVNGNAPPWLATAGTGDVLTGIVAAQLGQLGRGSISAEQVTKRVACAVWLHGEAAKCAGPGMVASDMETALHDVLKGTISPEFQSMQAD